MKDKKFPVNDRFYFDCIDYTDWQGNLMGKQHYHNDFEIYYIEKGNCNYFIDNKSYLLLPGDLALIPQGIVHNTLYTESRSSRLLIYCSQKYVPSSVMFLFTKNNYVYRNTDIKETIHNLLLRIQDEYNNSDDFSNGVITCYVRILLYTMARNKNQYTHNSKTSYVEKAINHINGNYYYDISLNEMSKTFSVSSEHFSRQFKKETGFGFNEYINLIRLKKAEELLLNKSFSVSEIALKCGFNDCNYFSTKFKKI